MEAGICNDSGTFSVGGSTVVLSRSSFKFSPAANFARSSELAAHVWVPNDTEFVQMIVIHNIIQL